jgi:hypothetical protein
MTYLNMLQLYLLEDHQPNVLFQQNGAPPHIGLVLSENFLKCIFLGAGLGVIDQFRGLPTHPILCRLISSCGIYKTPVTSLHELKLRIVAAIEKELHRKCWRTLGGKWNTAWTS